MAFEVVPAVPSVLVAGPVVDGARVLLDALGVVRVHVVDREVLGLARRVVGRELDRVVDIVPTSDRVVVQRQSRTTGPDRVVVYVDADDLAVLDDPVVVAAGCADDRTSAGNRERVDHARIVLRTGRSAVRRAPARTPKRAATTIAQRKRSVGRERRTGRHADAPRERIPV